MSGETKITSLNTLTDVANAFNSLKVLIIGDVMIDSYLWGKVERISPEAPVPIVNVQKRDFRLGGAANVALNVQSLGATPLLCSVIGNDLDGNNFLSLLANNNLSPEGIIRSENRITTIKHRVISGSHHMLRVDQEIDHEINAEEQQLLIKKAHSLIPQCDVVIFEDYDKGVLNEAVISEIIDFARKAGVPTVVDPKKRNFLHYKKASLFKPNKKELREGLKIESSLNEISELESCIKVLQSHLATDCVLITLSEKGIYITNEKEKYHIPAHVREISDVSGAGDTVISIAALCYALQLPAKFVAGLSNLGGGLVCEYVGVVPVNKKQLFSEAEKLAILPA
ncbi:MAG TPA: bifunctional ADP-heptose synthase [Cytophagaceae bacterium]